jgi:hypothetical protein
MPTPTVLAEQVDADANIALLLSYGRRRFFYIASPHIPLEARAFAKKALFLKLADYLHDECVLAALRERATHGDRCATETLRLHRHAFALRCALRALPELGALPAD